jgi:hypothetical protein
MQMNRSSFSTTRVCPLVETPVADEDPPLVGSGVDTLPNWPEDPDGRSRTFWKATVQSVVPFFPPKEYDGCGSAELRLRQWIERLGGWSH